MKIFGRIIFLLIIYTSCKEDKEFIPKDYPFLETLAVSNITSEGSIMLNGNLLDIGTSEIIDHGFIWDVDPELSPISPNKKSLGKITTTGTFSFELRSGIVADNTYYFRAFAENQNKIVFGNLIEFDAVRNSPIHSITDFSPKTSTWEDEVLITGENFDANNQSNNSIKFGTYLANIIEVTDTTIRVEVPLQLDQIEAQIEVSIGENSLQSNSSFKLNGPETISFSPLEVGVGNTVILSGKNFHPFPIRNIVTFGGEPGDVLSASSESLEVSVPVLNPGQYDININIFGQSVTFIPKIIFIGPEPGTFEPTSGISGSEILISGNNFGNTISLVEVFFNSTPAQVIEVSNSLMKTEVPALPSGDYSITVAISGSQVQFPGVFTVIPSPTPTTGLVAYYPFNGNANDLSGNGFNGTFFGSPTLTSDRNSSANSAYSFDGVDDWIETSTEIDQLLENGFTFSAWIYLEQLNQNTHTIFSNYNGNSPTGNCNTRIGFHFRVNGNGALRIFYAWDGNDRFGRDSDAGRIQLNTWYHVIATWDGNISTTGFKLYLNAVRVDKNDYSEGFFNCGGFLESLDPIRIGINECGSTQGPCHPFAGKIDDIRIYERILNEIEIDALSNE